MKMLNNAGVRGLTRGLLFVLATSCGATTVEAAEKPGTDLLKEPHVYLLRGDDKFGNFAPDYSHTIPTLDSTILIEIKSFLPKKSKESDSAQYLAIQLQRPMALKVVVADSTERGIVVYEFEQAKQGEFSFGVADWPKHLSEKLADQSTIVVYVVSDKRLQRRYKFALDARHHLVRGTDATPAGK
jgi:hypothetical protein